MLAAANQKRTTKKNTGRTNTRNSAKKSTKKTTINTAKGKTTANGRKRSSSKRSAKENQISSAMVREAVMLTVSAIALVFLLCNFGLGGKFGTVVSSFMFGLFGITAYIFPILLFVGVLFWMSNVGSGKARIKLIASLVVYFAVCAVLEQISFPYEKDTGLMVYYKFSAEKHLGGGWFGALLGRIFVPIIGELGMHIFMIAVILAGIVLITEKSLVGGVKKHGSRMVRTAAEDTQRFVETRKERREEKQQQIRTEKKKKVVASATFFTLEEENVLPLERTEEEVKIPYEEQEIDTNPIDQMEELEELKNPLEAFMQVSEIEERPPQDMTIYQNVRMEDEVGVDIPPEMVPFSIIGKNYEEVTFSKQEDWNILDNYSLTEQEEVEQTVSVEDQERIIDLEEEKTGDSGAQEEEIVYQFPSISLLKKGKHVFSEQEQEVENQIVAQKLEATLRSFGVGVTVTDVTSGPTVTRYELLPNQGVKVSRIVGLADDIKLSLAAADIRIEAPIPGKSAVGIEVPNKEVEIVMLRDLLESENFQQHSSQLAFAVGKDIEGKTIVTDIAKMPHALIAGATGSGKSVCINTLIMSILYKAHPEDVKLIMIDPKVVELSVYNGIPHLLNPVVTDPKKAAGALNWAVAEMTDRYHKFSEWNVRNIQGYNEKVELLKEEELEEKIQKMPQIVIIIDELADLMMVASNEVEEAICRLAQLARAAGIHLIIATQRPSVNVITGLIKANVPSRIAFAVSSGVDSRTILDTVGAEKLLGRGDMLFAPYGASSPTRIQGAFVSDAEVSAVVEFLKGQKEFITQNTIASKMMSAIVSESGSEGGSSGRDEHFVEAGRLILQSEKASIGMLQRKFKIGFNRAARIMDQLADAKVVGPEEGTKPRKILMSLEEFEETF